MSNQPFSPDSFTSFGDLLKFLRRRERLTQLELSVTVGYSEAQIGRLEKNQRRPDLTTLKALFLPALHLEDAPELSARLVALAESARQEDTPAPGIAPYKGLFFFDEPDADLFFGRESLTTRLADRVKNLAVQDGPRFLAVVGASGVGKSSLVRAGLAVTLKQAGWDVRVCTPTAEPLKSLEAQLASTQATTKPGRGLILVDQFEETFTLCRDETARAAFIDQLLALAQAPGGRTSIAIALRADFYSHCAQYPRLRQAVAAQQEYIGQMTIEELRQAIEEPARRGGWQFETGLVDVLLQDVGAQGSSEPQPGALPLLSHVLLATWERRRGRTFTFDGYQASGAVRGAIAETAEGVYTDQLNESQQQLARGVFLRLTELGEGTEDTRRRVALNELVQQTAEAPQLRAVLNTLAEARLITLNEDTAEVAHEALIREWQRLHEWLSQDREGLRLHRHLTESAHEWETYGRDTGAVYRGAQLAQALEWAETNAERLNESERAFLAAGLAQEQQESLERESQRQRELEAARRLAEEQERRADEQAQTAQQLTRRAVVLAGALVLAVSLAGAALFFGRQAATRANEAQAEQQTASARELSASAISNLSVDPQRSLLLSRQAVKTSRQNGRPVLVEAEDALHRSVQSSRELATWRGQTASLWSVALSRDGVRLAAVGIDGTATVWNVATGQVMMTLPTQVTDNLNGTGAVFSADGTQLLTVSGDNTATLWDVSDGEEVRTLKGHHAVVTSVAISPDGQLFATASDDTTVKLWEAATGKELKTLTGHEGGVLVLAFSADGQRIFAGSDSDGYAIAWEVATGKELFRLSGQGQVIGVDAIAVSPDGTRLATGEFDTTVKVWDSATGGLLFTLFGHSSQVVSVAFSADGKRLVSGSEDGTAKVWDLLTGKELLTLAGHSSGVLGAVFSPDGNRLYTASRDATIKSWDVSPTAGSDWMILAGHTDRIGFVTYSPDGTRLATYGLDGTANVWEAASGKILLTLAHGDTNCVGNVSYSPDGSRLVVAGGTVPKIVNAVSGAEILALAPFTDNVCNILFSADGQRLAAGSDGGLIRIYDSASGKILVEFVGSPAGIQQIAFSPDGQRVATANNDGATIWDVTTGKKLIAFYGHGADVRLSGIAFSPDGELVATAGNDSAIRVWNSRTGVEVYQLSGHTGPAFAVAFSPDGQYLASASVDRTIKLWSLPGDGGQVTQPLTLYGHTAAVYRVAFSPDGKQLASVGRNPVVRVYALNINDLMAVAKTRLTRTFTAAECQQFLHVAACPSDETS